MRRNVKKNLEEYQKRFVSGNEGSLKTTFYKSDFDQIRDLSGGDSFMLMDKALIFGFMMGVKYAESLRKDLKQNES